jgi:hypothetical protein
LFLVVPGSSVHQKNIVVLGEALLSHERKEGEREQKGRERATRGRSARRGQGGQERQEGQVEAGGPGGARRGQEEESYTQSTPTGSKS